MCEHCVAYIFIFFCVVHNCFTLNSGKWFSRIECRSFSRCTCTFNNKTTKTTTTTCFILNFSLISVDLWFQSHTIQKKTYIRFCNKLHILIFDVGVRNSIPILNLIFCFCCKCFSYLQLQNFMIWDYHWWYHWWYDVCTLIPLYKNDLFEISWNFIFNSNWCHLLKRGKLKNETKNWVNVKKKKKWIVMTFWPALKSYPPIQYLVSSCFIIRLLINIWS